jgi:hypothetical protein
MDVCLQVRAAIPDDYPTRLAGKVLVPFDLVTGRSHLGLIDAPAADAVPAPRTIREREAY